MMNRRSNERTYSVAVVRLRPCSPVASLANFVNEAMVAILRLMEAMSRSTPMGSRTTPSTEEMSVRISREVIAKQELSLCDRLV